MRLYHRGDRGEPVRDIQDRLSAVGFPSAPDPRGFFGEATESAVRAFQSSRGLPTDGLVGPNTWRALIEAGYRLGDRLLYLRVPMMRGEDVAELQRRLNALGFDAGKVDGIFGQDTLRALLDFQHNRNMVEDGIAGPGVAAELGLMDRATRKPGREQVRDRMWLDHLPRPLVGERFFVDPFCRTLEEAAVTWPAAVGFARTLRDRGAVPLLGRSVDTAPAERTRAGRANRWGADVVVAFALPETEGEAVLFFASDRSRSTAGEAIALRLAADLDLPTRGRAIPILKETRAPAVAVLTREPDRDLGRRTALAIAALYRDGPPQPSRRR